MNEFENINLSEIASETESDVELLLNNGFEDVIVYENPSFNGALIGVTDTNRAVYDFNKMVEYLMTTDGMDELEAIEWIEYNTMRANPYIDGAPVIMYPLNKSL